MKVILFLFTAELANCRQFSDDLSIAQMGTVISNKIRTTAF